MGEQRMTSEVLEIVNLYYRYFSTACKKAFHTAWLYIWACVGFLLTVGMFGIGILKVSVGKLGNNYSLIQEILFWFGPFVIAAGFYFYLVKSKHFAKMNSKIIGVIKTIFSFLLLILAGLYSLLVAFGVEGLGTVMKTIFIIASLVAAVIYGHKSRMAGLGELYCNYSYQFMLKAFKKISSNRNWQLSTIENRLLPRVRAQRADAEKRSLPSFFRNVVIAIVAAAVVTAPVFLFTAALNDPESWEKYGVEGVMNMIKDLSLQMTIVFLYAGSVIYSSLRVFERFTEAAKLKRLEEVIEKHLDDEKIEQKSS
ncbi:hypothetical protein NSQ26_09965 [Bacillus sp. FSL W7-1360]